MKRRTFLENTSGISLMYDAILFVVMVSLAGVILLPLSQTPIARKSSVDKHREDVVDNALHTFFVSRPDVFRYRFCGTLLDDVAKRIGINVSSDGLYGAFTEWLLAHEQRHKTYATLLAENLGCQFQLPFSFFGIDRLNLFTEEYDFQLRNETERFFRGLFGEKYHYNLTSWWHPIKGIRFGGEFSVGMHPPTKDCYVAHTYIIMPYTPAFSFHNHTVVFTKQWLRNQLFSKDGEFGNSSIPAIANMSFIFENYTNAIPPFDTKENVTKAIQENLSFLLYGFLIDGIIDDTKSLVFPGIVSLCIGYGFETIQNIAIQFIDQALDELFGETIRTIDRLFGSLNTSTTNPYSNTLLEQLNGTISSILNTSFLTLNDALDACETFIKEHMTVLFSEYLDALLESFVNTLLDIIDTINGFNEMLLDFLFDRISLNSAEVMLTIWVVRE
jgi:hypothetical protein